MDVDDDMPGASDDDRRGAMAAATGLLLLAAAAGLVLWRHAPPAPLPADAPAELFSAGRAMRHVERLAARPRPVGSEGHREAREYIVSELRQLGLEPRIQDGWSVERREVDEYLAARVRNIVVRLPGRDSTGVLMLMAHYDTRPNTPGAGDDASGVATLLETLRLAAGGPAARNDLVALFTDAEELGLMGARLFVDEHPWAEEVAFVLNFEARGNRGPSPMFETGPGNAAAVATLAAAVDEPFANSMSYEIYRRMPNDTDFTVFKEAGFQGFNMAFIGGLPAYHTMLDRPENLAPGSLQHHGAYAAGLVRHLGDADLEALAAARAEDAVYFNPFPWTLVVYPASLVVPLALLAAGLAGVAALLGGRRGRLRASGVGRGIFQAVTVTAASAGLGWLAWQVVGGYFPGLTRSPHGLPYATGLWALGLALLATAVAAALAGQALERTRATELALGSLLLWVALSVVLAVWVPGASWVAVWPALGYGGGLLALLAPARRGSRSSGRPLLDSRVLAVAALPAVLLVTPLVSLVFEALTLRQATVPMAVLGLLLALLTPLLGRLHRAGGGRWSVTLLLLGVAAIGGAVLGGGRGPEHPAVDTLLYGLDAESGEAWWASLDEAPDDWTSSVLGESPERRELPVFARPGRELLTAPAAPGRLEGPIAERLDDRRGVGREVELRLRSRRAAPVLRVRAEVSVPLIGLTVAGRDFDLSGDPEAEGLGELRIACFGADEEGVDIGLRLDAAWPVELELIDQSWGLDDLPSSPSPRPPDLIPSSSWRTDAVYVRSTELL